jgi:flagellar P-ring protein precursor FlgI
LNHPTAGRIPQGATVERNAPRADLSQRIKLQLHSTDFTTASRIAAALNKKFGEKDGPVASADSGRIVSVAVPASYAGRPIDFVADMENLKVETDTTSRVTINERTGTIIMGKEVRIAPVAIMHGNLSVEVQTTYTASQPGPLGQGETTVVPETKVKATEEKSRNVVLKEGATVEDLVRALGAIGSTPRDIIAILESLKAGGALQTDVEVI